MVSCHSVMAVVLLGLAALYAAKMLLLLAAGYSIGASPELPVGDTSRADAAADASTGEEQLFARSRSETYVAAAEALREGEYQRAQTELDSCGPEDGGCIGLRGEARLIGAGVDSNISAALELFKSAAELGDADSQYALGVLYSNMVEYAADVPEDGVGAENASANSSGSVLHGRVFRRSEEALSILYLYAASLAGHPGAMMAMGYRHAQGYGVPKSCTASALNYLEVARRVAAVYSAGMPQAVELVRLGVDGHDRKAMSASEVNLFVELAASGDANVAAAVGKRYLLGIEGFRQNYKRAAEHLRIAGKRNHAGAMALLGYMYCLGLGVAKSLEVAYSYFVSSAMQEDPLGHNGLGYFYFHGFVVASADAALSFQHFNSSAYGGSADGMFNLASMYLTGVGTEQSFTKAMLWYMQALDRGHTSAAYTLAVMHLNGIGTVRNCNMAVELLKRVCERGGWVSKKLQEAYDHKELRPESAAWLFLRLAEAGHEVAQMNIAHMLDTGAVRLLQAEPVSELTANAAAEAREMAKIHAQRHYQMSAEQGNVLSELRLGDYAYYGWGIRVDDGLPRVHDEELMEDDAADVEEELLAGREPDIRLLPQEADVELSMAHYKRTSNMRVTGEWMQPFVARASFNLGYMHQFGIGVLPSAALARHHYHRCLDVDPDGVHMPVGLMLFILTVQSFLVDLPFAGAFLRALLVDLRLHLLCLHLVAALVLLVLRRRVFQQVAPQQNSVPSSVGSSSDGT